MLLEPSVDPRSFHANGPSSAQACVSELAALAVRAQTLEREVVVEVFRAIAARIPAQSIASLIESPRWGTPELRHLPVQIAILDRFANVRLDVQ